MAAGGDGLGGITLVTGSEEFLAERAVSAVRAAVRQVDAEAEHSDTTADQLTLGTLGELSAPSLFSSTRCVVVRRLEDLPEESVSGVLDYAANPAPEVALVLVHSGGQKGSGVLTKLRKVPAVTEVKTVPLKPSEFSGWTTAELRSHGVRIDPEACDLLVQAVGQNLRALSAAASQLAGDFEGRPLTVEMVKQYFGGRAEAKSFAVADLTMAGRTAAALEELRWALERGTAPVLITSAMASGVRNLARYQSARKGRDADVAREVGVPPWKLRDLRGQSSSWSSDGLAAALQVVARSDADIKGQAHDPAYSLERMVLQVSRLRTGRR